MLPGFEGLSYGERLRRLGFYCLQRRKIKGDLIEVHKIIRGGGPGQALAGKAEKHWMLWWPSRHRGGRAGGAQSSGGAPGLRVGGRGVSDKPSIFAGFWSLNGIFGP